MQGGVVAGRQVLFSSETFESAIHQQQQNFRIEKTLIRGIQLNDATKIVDSQQERPPQTTQQFDPQTETEKIAFQMRRKYDHLATSAFRIKQEIELMKEEKLTLELEKTKLDEEVDEKLKELKNVQTMLLDGVNTMESALLNKGVRVHLEDRLREDILYYKKKCYDAEIELMKRRVKLGSLNQDSTSKNKLTNKCRIILKSIQRTVVEKEEQFEENIQVGQQSLSKRQDFQRLIFNREDHLEKSMVSAMNERLPEERTLRSLLFTNLLAKRLLKCKMQRLMTHYGAIEQSYNVIKQNTSITKAEDIVDQYINRDNIYGQLLQSIAIGEEKRDAVKMQYEKLKQQQSKLLEEEIILFEEENKREIGAKRKDSTKIIEQYNRRLLFFQRMSNMIGQYGVKTLMSFYEVPKQKIDKSYAKLSKFDMLKDCVKCLIKFLDGLARSENPEIKSAYIEKKELVSSPFEGETFRKNFRVKTISHGNSIRDEDREESFDQGGENEHWQQNRKSTKKRYHLARNRLKTKAA